MAGKTGERAERSTWATNRWRPRRIAPSFSKRCVPALIVCFQINYSFADIMPMNPVQYPLHFIRTQACNAPNRVAITTEIESVLGPNAVVAVGVSGGRDSQAAALSVNSYLDSIGFEGTRVLVHSHLGRVEWKASLPNCERLAEHLGWELMIVKRRAGDMMDRWITRWTNNVERYANLSCVKLILPWSTPSLRFCTSELKVSVITSALKRRFPNRDIVNAAGIRREESTRRSKMPVAAIEQKLARKGHAGFNWHPIIDWKMGDVHASIEAAGLQLHEAYTTYGASRVSCAYCIMSKEADLRAAASCVDNQDIYIEMVELEAESTFAFQGNRWLADVAPHLLSEELRARILLAKDNALRRERIEAQIPPHLLYVKGWPTAMPSVAEAELLAAVRRDVADLIGLRIRHTIGDEIRARYADLLALKAVKQAAKRPSGKASEPTASGRVTASDQIAAETVSLF